MPDPEKPDFAKDFTLTDEAFQGYVRDHNKLTLDCLKEDKHRILFQIGKKFYDEKMFVMAVILASECWTSKRSEDGDWPDVQPRHDPLRTESILVAGAGLPNNKQQRMVIMTQIKRDKDDNMVIDGESEESTEAEFHLINHFWRGYFSQVKRP